MRVLLVTESKQLAEKLAVLNPELEYCAIVVNEVKSAKEVLKRVGLSQDLLYTLDKLRTCVENFNYDYVLCVQETFYNMNLISIFRQYGLPTEKVVSLATLPTAGNWETKRHLIYYKEHSQEFEIFATGTSYTEAGIDIRRFKYKTINFGTSSQDLYYSFQIAKSVVLYGEGHSKIRYALIGLAPYVFNFDLSKTFNFKSRLLPYLIAFDDLHNFPVPIEIYKNFFRKEWFKKKVSMEKVNINGIKKHNVMTNPLLINSGVTPWDKKYYPETREEYVKILDDYLTLCEENNIRPVMFMAPSTEKFINKFNKQILKEFYSYVKQACQKHPSAVFVDGWKLNLVTYNDFYDHGHMNIYGAAKFSSYLNDFIEKLEAQGG